MKFTVQFDEKLVNEAVRQIGKTGGRKATVDSINFAIAKENRLIQKDLAAEMGVPLKSLNKRVKTLKASVKRISAVGYVKVWPLRPPALQVTPLGRGGVKLGSGKLTHTVKDAFQQDMPWGGYRNWYQRLGPEPYPIRRVALDVEGPARKVLPRVRRRMIKKFEQVFPEKFEKAAKAIVARYENRLKKAGKVVK